MLHGDRATSKLMIPSNISALGLKDFPGLVFSGLLYQQSFFAFQGNYIKIKRKKKHKMAATTVLLHPKLSHCLQMAILRCCDYDSLLFQGGKTSDHEELNIFFTKVFCNHLLLKGLLHWYIMKMLYLCACAFVEVGYVCICIIIFRLCL